VLKQAIMGSLTIPVVAVLMKLDNVKVNKSYI